jgi:hypothetical protein
MIAAARGDAETYEDIERDSGSTGSAILVVLIASVAAALGMGTPDPASIVSVSLAAVATGWALNSNFVDQGPGIADLNRALAGGFSTAKSLGLGLSGTRRLVDEFEIETEPGRGTKITIRKWKKEF